jgi:hypothetical protein
MRIIGTLKQYGNEVQGTTNDGKTWKRREVIVDASYRTDRGDDIEQSFAGSTFKEFTDEQLEQWAQEKKQLAFYINFRAREFDGRYYQDVNITNIREVS